MCLVHSKITTHSIPIGGTSLQIYTAQHRSTKKEEIMYRNSSQQANVVVASARNCVHLGKSPGKEAPWPNR